MIGPFRLRSLLAILLVLPLTGFAQFNGPADSAKDPVNAPHVLTTDLSILYPAKHDTILHGGDVLTLSIYGISDYSVSGRISEEGYFTVPLIAPVRIDGLTVREAQALIARKLEDAQMFRDPPVRIQVTESVQSQIIVIGDTHGTVPGISGGRRLFDVLASSGGLQSTSSHFISIERPGLAEPINLDLGTDPERGRFSNIPVFPGDTIVTSRIGDVYMVGAWKTQGKFPLLNNTPLTLLQAYTLANGKYLEGKANELHLIRTTGTTRTVTIVHMDDVLKGKLPDPVLQSDDIVYLPSSKILGAIRGGGLTTGIGLALTLAYAFRF